MSIERIFHCDGPDCERFMRTMRRRTDHFLVVSEGATALHFCGWDCVLRHAAAKEPEQVVAAGPDPGSLERDY